MADKDDVPGAPASLPRISIVTPSFNQARFLDHTLRSVLDQNYPNLEYVVIDGGSTDGSVDIIKHHAPRLAYWLSEPDHGHGHALNKGFQRTTGEIMAWLNSDDLYFPWTLQTVAEIFSAHPDIAWLTAQSGAIFDSEGRIVSADRNFNSKYDYLLGRHSLQQESTFWRRSLWEAAGGTINEDYKLMVDGELWTRFFLKAPLYHVARLLGGFRRWGENRSLLDRAQCEAEMKRCVEVMRYSSDAQTLFDLAILQRVRKVKPGIRRQIARKIIHRMKPSLKSETAYDVVLYRDQSWRCGKYPFSI